jgi:hypothetical protein
MSLKVSQEDNDFRPLPVSSTPLLLKATSEALEVIGTPQQQSLQQQSAVQSQEATICAIATAAAAAPFSSAAASVDSAVALSTEQNISSILFRGRSVQEWVDIATRSLSEPERKKREYTIALGSFEYTVDEDDLKAFLEEQARGKRGKVNY